MNRRASERGELWLCAYRSANETSGGRYKENLCRPTPLSLPYSPQILLAARSRREDDGGPFERGGNDENRTQAQSPFIRHQSGGRNDRRRRRRRPDRRT